MGIDAETYAAAKGYTDKMVEGGGGTLDYEALRNHPSINGNELVGNKSSKQLGIQNLFTGTTTEWAQLTADQKAQYTHVCFTDDTAQEVVVVANPEATATAELTKLQVGQEVYSIPSGEAVADNTAAIEAIVNKYGAKNLAPNNATNITESAYQFTVNSDKSITINKTGNMTQWGLITLAENFLLKAGKYFLSTGTSEYKGNAFLEVIIDGVNYGTSYGSDGTIDFELQSDKLVTWRACIFPDSTTFNVTIYPMIRDARITDPTYVPYAMTNEQLTDETILNRGLYFGDSINLADHDWWYGICFDHQYLAIFYPINIHESVAANKIHVGNLATDATIYSITGAVSITGLSAISLEKKSGGIYVLFRCTSNSDIPTGPVTTCLVLTISVY